MASVGAIRSRSPRRLSWLGCAAFVLGVSLPTLGQAEVRQLFRASKIGTIAGSFVTEGKVTRGAKVRVVREGTVIYDTTIDSLRRFNDDAREVASGFECGIVLTNFQDLREGDVLETYETRLQERELSN